MNKQEIISNINVNYERISKIVDSNNRIDYIRKKIYSNNVWIPTRNFAIIISLLLLSPQLINLQNVFLFDKNFFFKLFTTLINVVFLSFLFALVYFIVNTLFLKKIRFIKMKPKIQAEMLIIKKNIELCDNDCVLPNKYRNEHSLFKIREYFKNLRVDTLKEAINLYEDESLRVQNIERLDKLATLQNTMINKQREMIREQKKTNFLLTWNSFNSNHYYDH